jgi:hypothetical protein
MTLMHQGHGIGRFGQSAGDYATSKAKHRLMQAQTAAAALA